MSRIRRPLLLAAGYVILIFVVSSIPSLTAPGPEFVPKDKIAHFAEYFVLGVLLFKGIGWTVTPSRAATGAFIVAVGASVGALDEIYQSFVPGRMMSLYDWFADVAGVAAGAAAFVFTRWGGRRKGESAAGWTESAEERSASAEGKTR